MDSMILLAKFDFIFLLLILSNFLSWIYKFSSFRFAGVFVDVPKHLSNASPVSTLSHRCSIQKILCSIHSNLLISLSTVTLFCFLLFMFNNFFVPDCHFCNGFCCGVRHIRELCKTCNIRQFIIGNRTTTERKAEANLGCIFFK